MPVISVIIPAYNAEKTIAQTIESVLNQSFVDFEAIVINDGSTDLTLDILGQIEDPRIQVFSYGNAGVSAARNRGISQAAGEFIAFLDADDLWTPDKLEKQLQALQDHPQAAVAYSWTDYIDESGNFLRPGDRITVSGNVYEQLLLRNFIANGSNPLIRRDALQVVGGFNPELTHGEDWDLWLRLAANYQFVPVHQKQILYRLSPQAASANLSKMKVQSLTIIDLAFSQAPASLQPLKRASIANLYQYLMFRVLESRPGRSENLAAARYFCQMVWQEPAILKRRSRLMAIVLSKIVLGILLPQASAKQLLAKIKNLFLKNT